MTATRKDRRSLASLKVKYRSATVEQFVEQFGTDISRGGIFVKASKPLAVGALLKFEFQLASQTPVISGVGRVAWRRTEPAGSQPPGMGIKFLKLDHESRARVDQIVGARSTAASRYDNTQGAELAPPMTSEPPLLSSFPPAVRSAPAERRARSAPAEHPARSTPMAAGPPAPAAGLFSGRPTRAASAGVSGADAALPRGMFGGAAPVALAGAGAGAAQASAGVAVTRSSSPARSTKTWSSRPPAPLSEPGESAARHASAGFASASPLASASAATTPLVPAPLAPAPRPSTPAARPRPVSTRPLSISTRGVPTSAPPPSASFFGQSAVADDDDSDAAESVRHSTEFVASAFRTGGASQPTTRAADAAAVAGGAIGRLSTEDELEAALFRDVLLDSDAPKRTDAEGSAPLGFAADAPAAWPVQEADLGSDPLSNLGGPAPGEPANLDLAAAPAGELGGAAEGEAGGEWSDEPGGWADAEGRDLDPLEWDPEAATSLPPAPPSDFPLALSPMQPHAASASRSRALPALLVVFALLLAAGGAWLFLGRDAGDGGGAAAGVGEAAAAGPTETDAPVAPAAAPAGPAAQALDDGTVPEASGQPGTSAEPGAPARADALPVEPGVGQTAADGPRVPLEISSSPRGAQVFVDGKPRGETPMSVALVVGRPVKLELRAVGHAPVSRTLMVGADSKTERFRLERLDFVLSVRTKPPGAEVSVRGRTRLSPAEIELGYLDSPASVSVMRPGYRRTSRPIRPGDFSLRDGMLRASLDIELSPLPGPAAAALRKQPFPEPGRAVRERAREQAEDDEAPPTEVDAVPAPDTSLAAPEPPPELHPQDDTSSNLPILEP